MVPTEYHYGYSISYPEHVFVIGKPFKSADWETMPSIRVCKDTGISVRRINHATSFWRKLGYKFDHVSYDTSNMCAPARYGEIVISLPDGSFDNTKIASTRTYTRTSTGKIVKAIIFIMPKDARRLRVIEHEMGHAIGWKHYNKKFHIMHSNWIMGGYDDFGLENGD